MFLMVGVRCQWAFATLQLETDRVTDCDPNPEISTSFVHVACARHSLKSAPE